MTVGDTDTADVIVIGAGIGGLRAATSLQQRGHRTIVLEARDRVGGRLRSIPVDPVRLDLGATWFWPTEPLINELTTQLGTETFPQHLDGDMMFQSVDGVQRIQGNQLDVPSSRFVDGMEGLAERLAKQLDVGSLHLSTDVQRVAAGANGALSVETATSTWNAQHVVLAVPPALAVAAIDLPGLDDCVRALATATPVWMGGIVKVVAVYPTPFWRADGLAGAAFSHVGPLREIHDMSGPDGTPAALFGFAQPGPGVDPPSPAEVIVQLTAIFGPLASSPDAVHIADWRNEPHTTPPAPDPSGDYGTYGHARYQEPALDGRLHWASSETSTEAPGHVEGALVAGARAATAIDRALRGSAATPDDSEERGMQQ